MRNTKLGKEHCTFLDASQNWHSPYWNRLISLKSILQIIIGYIYIVVCNYWISIAGKKRVCLDLSILVCLIYANFGALAYTFAKI